MPIRTRHQMSSSATVCILHDLAQTGEISELQALSPRERADGAFGGLLA